MGLTNHSTGRHTAQAALCVQKQSDSDKIIALAGNPNVGKSTLFNGLTGMHQHTGNWPGKTVSNAQGTYKTDAYRYILVDIPGTYSLMAHSAEETVARDFLCFGKADAVVIVCDATCLERNLNLVLQTLEVADRVVVCINLMDEAKRHGIYVDTHELSKQLGTPVVGITARDKHDLERLMRTVDNVFDDKPINFTVEYPASVEEAIDMIAPTLYECCEKRRARWLALKLLEEDPAMHAQIANTYGKELLSSPVLQEGIAKAKKMLRNNDRSLADLVVGTLVNHAEAICKRAVRYNAQYTQKHKADRFLTGRVSGYATMLVLLAVIFWLTIVGANYPSQLLSDGLLWVQDRLSALFCYMNAPDWLHGAVVLGIYRVLAWVVSVMLPPMAIFFPLFTLLEDVGYLPRIAYNLDKPFQKCHACGKQALTMCMGFGCNAAGVVGCRIIDSPRERLLAVLTNSFVPCNGRFPTLIALLTMFFVGSSVLSSLWSATLLTLVILLGIFATFYATKLLSKTILKGIPSSFTLELPPFRRPQIGKVIWRSLWDRTIFVLGRAIAVAAPAGLLIWMMANVHIGDISLLHSCANLLDPFARLMGLDGVILMAFILGFPANEIVVPIIIMAYTASGTLVDMHNLTALKELLVANGWTPFTAISMMLFSLFHWPCSTTLITIKKETGSMKWTLLAAMLPTAIGIVVCMIFTALTRLTY